MLSKHFQLSVLTSDLNVLILKLNCLGLGVKYKILADSLALLGPLTGIGRYNYEILQYLSSLISYDLSYFYGYISKNLVYRKSDSHLKSMHGIITKSHILKSFARKITFPITTFFSPQYDLYWQPNFIPIPSIKAKKTVISVHDFSWEHYPEFQPQERIKYFKSHFYHSIHYCDHIITGSHYTKQEIIERTKISAEKITVIYHGIDHNIFFPRPKHKQNQNFILAVGSIEPRKNLKNLLLAYNLLDESLKKEYHLILVGAKGWNNQDIMALITAMQPFVSYSGYVDDETLAQLYSDATLFIYPSFYEGFGIPPLEAMASGTPVISSNASTLPEVCADAAYYIEPNDIEAIAAAMNLFLKNQSLQQEYIQKGLFRASLFSWEKSGREHNELFKSLLRS